MQTCRKCGVEVYGNKKCCPLCQGFLSGEADKSEDIFPNLDYVRKSGLILKIIAFSLISITVISITINLAFTFDVFWSGFVALGCACAMITSFVGLQKRGDVLKCIVTLEYICLPLGILWDYLTGWFDWSINYFYPSAVVMVTIALVVIAIVMKMPPQRYILSLTASVVAGLACPIFLALSLATVSQFLLIATGFTVIMIFAIIIFFWRTLQSEFVKKFHL